MLNILDEYTKKAPAPQTTVDLFANEWSSKLPDINNVAISTGHADLFNDNRIRVMNEKFSLEGKKVLELGPLEGAHTHMIAKFGATQITAVESNSRAFLKCLIVKELYNLNNVHFLLGDAIEYMDSCNEYFDICLASGILYHSKSPGKFIETISKISDRLFLWTHFYDEAAIKEKPDVYSKFKSKMQETIKGKVFDLYKYEYGEALDWKGFCGGSESYTTWITKGSMLELLALCGYHHVDIIFEDFNHPNGPNICLIAQK